VEWIRCATLQQVSEALYFSIPRPRQQESLKQEETFFEEGNHHARRIHTGECGSREEKRQRVSISDVPIACNLHGNHRHVSTEIVVCTCCQVVSPGDCNSEA
jgi:hypothetical protein